MEILFDNTRQAGGKRIGLKVQKFKHHLTLSTSIFTNEHKYKHIKIKHNIDNKIIILCKYLNELKPIWENSSNLHLMYAYFQHIMEYVIYQNKFNILHRNKKENILDYINYLPEIYTIDNIKSVFNVYYDKHHIVRNLTFYVDSNTDVYNFLRK